MMSVQCGTSTMTVTSDSSGSTANYDNYVDEAVLKEMEEQEEAALFDLAKAAARACYQIRPMRRAQRTHKQNKRAPGSKQWLSVTLGYEQVRRC